MKPNIYLDNGKWFVYHPRAQCFGFILQTSAYSYAKGVWEQEKKLCL